MICRSFGSSPLAQGTLLDCGATDRRVRFIPTGGGNTAARSSSRCQSAVHPRWRGEHATVGQTQLESNGSSLLARGTHQLPARQAHAHRFIPAGAGNTVRRMTCGRNRSVHPRWRGEHAADTDFELEQDGSSPLARGTPIGRQPQQPELRFIPAGAGNTCRCRSGTCPGPDHPRWRGEHAVVAAMVPSPDGSSPLARGTPVDELRFHAHRRFIPAGAGNTPWKPPCRSPATVHPRWRGEHGIRPGLPVRRRRFIPAGAGNTGRSRRPPAASTVHPRWRGEHVLAGQTFSITDGSSPLARGTLWLIVSAAWQWRFIPAGAGNRFPTPGRPRHPPVHPRWRGEHNPPRRSPPRAGGSSPLARGTLEHLPCSDGDLRFIPAGAGNTG